MAWVDKLAAMDIDGMSLLFADYGIQALSFVFVVDIDDISGNLWVYLIIGLGLSGTWWYVQESK